MLMPGRNGSQDEYRYGYQGSEKENEIVENDYSTHYRLLDTRIGRWFSLDPVTQSWQSPYCSMDNNPIALNDPLGNVVEYGTSNTGIFKKIGRWARSLFLRLFNKNFRAEFNRRKNDVDASGNPITHIMTFDKDARRLRDGGEQREFINGSDNFKEHNKLWVFGKERAQSHGHEDPTPQTPEKLITFKLNWPKIKVRWGAINDLSGDGGPNRISFISWGLGDWRNYNFFFQERNYIYPDIPGVKRIYKNMEHSLLAIRWKNNKGYENWISFGHALKISGVEVKFHFKTYKIAPLIKLIKSIL